MIIGGVALWVNRRRDIEDLQKWRVAHEQQGRERYAEVQASRAKIEEAQKGIQTDMVTMRRKSDNVDYRITVLEMATATKQAQQRRITELLADIQGDMKGVKGMQRTSEGCCELLALADHHVNSHL